MLRTPWSVLVSDGPHYKASVSRAPRGFELAQVSYDCTPTIGVIARTVHSIRILMRAFAHKVFATSLEPLTKNGLTLEG